MLKQTNHNDKGQLMLIGIVGLGVVGNACKFGFEKLGNTVFVHDIKLHTSINNVLPAEVIYVCVPTPSNDDGSCNTSIVESVVEELMEKNYQGIIAIKSTVKPGTTKKLIDKYNNDQICFVPEFLRERCSFVDFVEDHRLLAIGTDCDVCFEKIVQCHGNYPKNIMRMSATDAELLKLMHNTFNALRVVFANEFYDVCKGLNATYRNVKSGLLKTCNLPDIYLDVNESADGLRGYAGVCLTKDVPALCALAKELGLDYLKLFETIVNENEKFKKTVFTGMRPK